MNKTIVELFAGVGGFRLGMEMLNTGWNTAWFSQWEPNKKNQFAYNCYVSHFGESVDLSGKNTSNQDIHSVNKKDVPDHTLLTGGFPCFSAGMKVLTDKGNINIEDVTTGMNVMTKSGKFHKVQKLFITPDKPLFKIQAIGVEDIFATINHPFLVSDEFGNISYKKLCDISTKSDYLCSFEICNNCFSSHKVASIEKTNRIETVYNLEVETDHSYVVNGVVVHNCQDYSVAQSLSSSRGIEGKKGVLWWDIRDILLEKRPPFVILENVDRLLKSPASQRGRDFGIILYCFYRLGYHVEWRVVNAAEYGGPQKRRRTFIFASLSDNEFSKVYSNNSPEKILQGNGFMARAFPIESMEDIRSLNFEEWLCQEKQRKTNENNSDILSLKEPITENGKEFEKGNHSGNDSKSNMEKELLLISNHFQWSFENSGFMTDGIISTAKTFAKKEPPVCLGDVLEGDVPEKYYLTEENRKKWEYLKGGKKIKRVSKTGHEYIYSEGPVAFPDYPDRPARTMLTSEGTTNRSSHAVKDPVTGRIRKITPLEAERIQGFPDNWTNTGMSDSQRYFCMGNALVVPMITRMGKILDEILSKEK